MTVNEETIFRAMDLPEDLGRDWEWFADLNVVGFRRGMDCDAKLHAIEDMQRHWRRAHLSVVESA